MPAPGARGGVGVFWGGGGGGGKEFGPGEPGPLRKNDVCKRGYSEGGRGDRASKDLMQPEITASKRKERRPRLAENL